MSRSLTALVFSLASAFVAIAPGPAMALGETLPSSSMTMPMPTPMSGPPASVDAWANGAMPFKGLAKAHRKISTASPDAQRYFDQGMSLMWGFNHDEAARAFAKAGQIDPHCAICFWGLSLTVGPNYNLPFLSAQRAKVAVEALRRARAQAAHGSPVEKALIDALAKRYPDATERDGDSLMSPLTAYAAAMRDVAHGYPADLDVQTLYAESLMNLHAWKLWSADGAPAPGTLEIIQVLKTVLARDPNHVGANHYLVHAVEASPHPEDGLVAARRLETLGPAEGHLVHMPAHIMQRVGLYEEAAEANRRGVSADIAYTRLTSPPDYYAAMYTGHNYQFLAYSTAMEGRRAETLRAVDLSRAGAADAMLLQMPGSDWYVAELYLARVRFGLWAQILAMAAPDPHLPGLTGGYAYARGMALAATGKVAEARASLDGLKAFAANLPPDAVGGQNALKDILAIAIPTVEARIARAEHRKTDEIANLRIAVAAEDRLAYDEPWNWFVPTRQVLGEALLRNGDAAGAEAAFRQDLTLNRDNGWALKGLAEALIAEGRTADAAATSAAFRKAWRRADVSITTAAF